jgi:ribosomal-protein-alanine N-acetyltransferase
MSQKPAAGELSCSRQREVPASWSVRNLLEQDLPAIMDIELASYAHPWTEALFISCIEGGYISRVLVEENRIIGYLIVSVAVGECHILNVCSAPAGRRRGVARYLLTHIFEEAQALGAEQVFLEVRPSNVNAIGLYEALGFEQVGRRKNYYPAAQGREDALLYRLELVPAA